MHGSLGSTSAFMINSVSRERRRLDELAGLPQRGRRPPRSGECGADKNASRQKAMPRKHQALLLSVLSVAQVGAFRMAGSQELPEPKMLPKHLAPVASFDIDLLPETIAPWVADIAERMQCPPDFVAVPAMVALGAVIGRKIGIRPQRQTDWTEVANLWGCIIGRPGMQRYRSMKTLQRFSSVHVEVHDHFTQEPISSLAKAYKQRRAGIGRVARSRGLMAAWAWVPLRHTRATCRYSDKASPEGGAMSPPRPAIA